jgi:hypothetical protein
VIDRHARQHPMVSLVRLGWLLASPYISVTTHGRRLEKRSPSPLLTGPLRPAPSFKIMKDLRNFIPLSAYRFTCKFYLCLSFSNVILSLPLFIICKNRILLQSIDLYFHDKNFLYLKTGIFEFKS